MTGCTFLERFRGKIALHLAGMVLLLLPRIAVPAWPPWLNEEERPVVYPEIVVSAEWLLERSSDPGLVVVDGRPREAFLRGHVPGALSLPADSVSPGVSVAGLLARRGVRQGEVAVLCGEEGAIGTAARLFYALEAAGVSDVRLLDRGVPGWIESGGALEGGAGEARAPTTPAAADTSRLARPEYVLDHFGRDGCELIDCRVRTVRPPEKREGWDEAIFREGHIPHAMPFFFGSLLGEGGEVPEGPRVRAVIAHVGPRSGTLIHLDGEVIVYDDGPSGDALLGYLLLRMAGVEQVRLFSGGFPAWFADPSRPVVRIDRAGQVAELLGKAREHPDEEPPAPALLFDVRHGSDYRAGHIPGAVHIPSSFFRDSLEVVLPRHYGRGDLRDVPLVTYCYGPDCIRSRNCATWAAQAGFRDVRWFRGGMAEWKAEGRKVEREDG